MNKNNNIGLYINKTLFQGMGDTLGALEKIEIKKKTRAVAQSVGPFALHAESWVFESRPRQTQVVKIGSDSLGAKRSAL